MSTSTIFFAYQGRATDTHDNNVESIRRAVSEYNGHQKSFIAKTWEEYQKTTHISVEVFRAIEDCAIFACDLTYFNHNVLFELGYAIGKGKQILILLNPDVEGAEKKYRNFFLKEVRYTQMRNSSDVQTALQQKHYTGGLLEKYVNTESFKRNSIDLLYIKNKQKNQASLDLTNQIQNIKIQNNLSLQVDDPSEVSYRSEPWYFQYIYQSKCVIIHLLGDTAVDAFSENARDSLLAGLAYGLGQKVLLVAPAKFRAPLDYHEILCNYTSVDDLLLSVKRWIDLELIDEQISREIEKIEEHKSNIIKLGVGSEIAEYEQDKLLKYFVETSSSRAALTNEQVIIVGRKGSGKTAIYIKLLNIFSQDRLNYVVDIKPESDELLEEINFSKFFKSSATKKFFFIAAWRLLVYSKLAYSIYTQSSPDDYLERTTQEKQLIDFVKKNESFMEMNVIGVIAEICKKIESAHLDINSPRVLENLYSEYLGQLIRCLKNYFKSIDAKYSQIIIIADNLDKAWTIDEDLDIQTEMIAALLEVSEKVKIELVNKNDLPIKFKTLIFLRRDIFDYILKKVGEPDKVSLMSTEINWEEYPELLKKVIENRFKFDLSLEEDVDTEEIWKTYFEFKKNRHPFEIIKSVVTLRPRDIIYFVNQLIASAINRGAEKINESDFNRAVQNYTNFLYENVIAETKAEYPEIGEILAKLQEHHGKKLEYKIYSRILDRFKYTKERQKALTKTLFERGYMVGYDNLTSQPFADVEILERKLKEKYFFIFPKKVYIIAHAKYYAIKNITNKAF